MQGHVDFAIACVDEFGHAIEEDASMPVEQ